MFRIVLLVVLVALAAAVKFLPWWALLVGLVLLVALLKLLGGRILEAVFKAPFKVKGKTLRGATAVVHSVEPAAPPAASEDEDPEPDAGDGEGSWFTIDVTIQPVPNDGPFPVWEPGELVLAPPDARPDDTDEDVGHVHNLEIFQDGQWAADEACKYPGEQRLRLLVKVRPGVTQARFRYYFELFGDVRLPALAPA